MATRPRVGMFALTVTVDLLLGFLLLAVVAAFAAIASNSHPPPPPPPPAPAPPDTAAYVAQRVHDALDATYPGIDVDPLTATVRLPGMFVRSQGQLRTTPCLKGASDAGEGCVQRMNGEREEWVPAQLFVSELADVLITVLPDFVDDTEESAGRRACEAHYGRACPGRLTTVFIEGHADRTAYDRAKGSSNSKLSLERALSVFDQTVAQQNDLSTLESGPEGQRQQMLAAAGFGCRRPAFNTVPVKDRAPFVYRREMRDERCPTDGDATNDAEEARNRRIELRFIVSLTPNATS